MNLNALARKITLREGLLESVSIAQVKEVLRITLEELGAQRPSEVLWLLEAHGAWPAHDWTKGLTTRAANCLIIFGLTGVEDALRAYLSGELRPNTGRPKWYGRETHREVGRWLGLPELKNGGPGDP